MSRGRRKPKGGKRRNLASKPRRGGGGGAATGGGISFQGAVTAIVEVHVARGRALGWFDGQFDDTPVRVAAETGGAGDDLRVDYAGGAVGEVQVKKGLSAGTLLWGSLQKLVSAIESKKIDFGVLVVSPSSSRTITTNLALDIIRLGDGREDGLSDITKAFLKEVKFEPGARQNVCKKLRVVTIHAEASGEADIKSARAQLEHLVDSSTQINAAWDRLYRDGVQLIERRRQRDASDVGRLLDAAGIALRKNGDFPASVAIRIAAWAHEANATYTIFGYGRPLSLDADWLEMQVSLVSKEDTVPDSIEAALARYHGPQSRRASRRDGFSAETIGRFIDRCVVIGGPGMGKTTLTAKLARVYASEGRPVLRARLRDVAARMRKGDSFEEALFDLGVAGSGIPGAEARKARVEGWVVLADGLDECGQDQDKVVAGLEAYLAGHPTNRVIITTRPIGYHSPRLANWRHYEVMAPAEPWAIAHASRLVQTAPIADDKRAASLHALKAATANEAVSDTIVRSPLLLGLAAALFAQGRDVDGSRVQLYRAMFELLYSAPNEHAPPSNAPAARLKRFLEILGWEVISQPLRTADDMVARAAEALGAETEEAPLLAQETGEACAAFWEGVGVVERVQHAGLMTLTFVHQTFAEFAAALHLMKQPLAEQQRLACALFKVDSWAEVFTFAASMGMGTVVGEAIIQDAKGEPSGAVVRRLLEMLRDSETPPSIDIRTKTFEWAKDLIADPRRERACWVGLLLERVAHRFGDEIAPVMVPLTTHAQTWTRAAAWASITAAGRKYFTLEELVGALGRIPMLEDERRYSSVLGGIRGISSETGLSERFVANAVREILEHWPEQADAIVPGALRDAGKYSMNFHMDVEPALRAHGKTYPIGTAPLGRATFVGSEKYEAAQRLAYGRLIKSISDATPNAASDAPIPRVEAMYTLAAFLVLSGFWELPGPDYLEWQTAHDASAAAEAAYSAILASPLTADALAEEAQGFIAALETEQYSNALATFAALPRVDALPLEWENLDPLALNWAELERALHHKSFWVMSLALQAFHAAMQVDELAGVVERVLAEGTDDALQAAAILAERLDPMRAREIMLARLDGPVVSGLQWVLQFFEAPDVEIPSLDRVRQPLLSKKPRVAIAAAILLKRIMGEEQAAATALAFEAYQHWMGEEEPYPKGTGIIPDSPRAVLLGVMLRDAALSATEVLQYANDDRSDVQNRAREHILERLGTSPAFRRSFVEALQTGDVSADLLRKALAGGVPFAPEEIEAILGLLKSNDMRLRVAAMGALMEAYLPRDRIVALAQDALTDDAQPVKDSAYRILEVMGMSAG